MQKNSAELLGVFFHSAPICLCGLVMSQELVELFGIVLNMACMMADVELKTGIDR